MTSNKPVEGVDGTGNEQLPPEVIAQAEAVASSSSDMVDEPSFYGPSNESTSMTKTDGSSKQRPSQGSIRPTDTKTAPGTAAWASSSRRRAGFAEEEPIEDVPPPVYSQTYGKVDLSQDGLNTQAYVASDGRLNINIDQKSRRLSNLLVPALRSQLNLQYAGEPPALPPGYLPSSLGGLPGQTPPPPLNVVIHVVGSRGDIQPFISLGQVLRKTYGHRVRLATHPVFRTFVEENDLEFFSIGGDPAELMAFMVKNPGLMPGMDALRSGDIGKRRTGMYEIVKGCWRSCFESGDGTGVEVSDAHLNCQQSFDGGISGSGDLAAKPFIADAIIANPPSFAHVHCAEKLGIPLHLMFTMPWSPTQAFPHPLANIQSSNADANMTNFLTYALVEMMTWQGLGDVINRFREKCLGLEAVSLMWAPGMASRLRIPYTYCWSPALIPKPKDWGPHISVSGFYFLSLANTYSPPPDLAEFLASGPPPVYIGFGSIVLDDPNAMTRLIFDAVKKTGERVLVSKGWGGFGADELGIPDGVFMLDNIPHDWLFRHVSCVVHHGGAGTTAAGIALGKPTVIVPFFGDQPFWGAMVAKAGAGPAPIPIKHLTADKLAAAISEALKPTTLKRAQDLGARIGSEKGSDVGAKSFHDTLDFDNLRCSLVPSRPAVWRIKRTDIKLSAFAAAVLGNEGLLDFTDLKLFRPREYDTEEGPLEPISGATSALLGTMGSMMMGVADFPIEIFRAMQTKPTDDRQSANGGKTPGAPSTPKSDVICHDDPALVQSETNKSAESSSNTLSRTASFSSLSEPSVLLSSNQQQSGNNLVTSDSVKDRPPLRPQSSRSSGGESLSSTPKRSPMEPSNQRITFDAALGAGKGVGRIVGAGLKSPMDFTLGLARGFHNAPKLYGDETVRRTEKITGLQSGLKAAGKEFGFGFYDGVSGLVTHPLEGAKKEGVTGLLKGFGKGVGGLVLKPGAAIWGLPGYTFKGVYKELRKHQGSSVQNYIIAARTAQGYDEWKTSTQSQRLDVVSRWHIAQIDLGKQKRSQERRSHSVHDLVKARSTKKADQQVQAQSAQEHSSRLAHDAAHLNASPSTENSAVGTHGVEFEEAIRQSVAVTSRGDPLEDQLIERAIRASVAELRLASEDGDDDDALKRAVQASVAEASRKHSSAGSSTYIEEDHRDRFEGSLYSSLRGQQLQLPIGSPDQDLGRDTGLTRDETDADTDDDSNMIAALEESKQHGGSTSPDVDADLRQALEESRLYHHAVEREKSEEEIVIEYVKRQSLAESQHKQKLAMKATDSMEDEKDMRRALEESLRLHSKEN
ncbi:MAG: hypothetical protein Q9187_006686 [Circinaria calcarea]